MHFFKDYNEHEYTFKDPGYDLHLLSIDGQMITAYQRTPGLIRNKCIYLSQ